MSNRLKSKNRSKNKKHALYKKAKNASNQDYQEFLINSAYYKAEQCGFALGLEEENSLDTDIIAMQILH